MKYISATLYICKRLAIIVAALYCSCYLSGNDNSAYYFKRLEVEDGLTQCMVYAICQDRQGFLWFGTQNGLNRYDGVSLKTYNLNRYIHDGLSSNSIFSISESPDGKIWIGTETGIVVFDPEFESFRQTRFYVEGRGQVSGIVRSIAPDSKGNMWAGVSGWGIFKFINDGKILHFPLDNFIADKEQLTSLCLDSKDNAYLISSRCSVLKIESDNKIRKVLDTQLHHLEDTEFNCIKIITDSVLLVGTVSHGVISVDTDSGKWEIPKFARALPRDSFVRSIETDNDGNYWFGTQHGLYVCSPSTGHMTHLEHSFADPYSLSDNAVHRIFKDREGGIWIGTYFGGVNYYSDSGRGFEKFYPSSTPGSLSGKCISEFCEDDEGRIWIGTEDAGLNIMNGDGLFSSVLQKAKNVHALMNDNGKMWVGTFSDGLFTIDTRSGNVCRISHSATGKKGDDNIYSIFKDSKENVWVGTRTGLERYDSASRTLVGHADFIKSQVNDIVETDAGQVLFATIGQGIFALGRDNNWKHLKSVSKKNLEGGKKVICMLNDCDDIVWAGTKGAGVVVLGRDRGIIKEFSTDNGLPDDVVYKLIKARDGGIWGSTNNGLFRIDPLSGSIRTYTHSDGLPGDQFNYKSGFVDQSGNIYFGGVKGFVKFRHDRFANDGDVPNIVFNSFKVDNEEISANECPEMLQRSINYSKELTLPYDKSSFTIGFGALDYTSPHRINYKYKLEGWDKDWIQAGEAHQATYSNLSPGKYQFMVKISDVYGKWNSASHQIDIIVKPPFYMTRWAYAIYIAAFLFCVYLAITINRRNLLRKEHEAFLKLQQNLVKEMYDMKINFFTNITHEIRTPLSLIKIPIEELLEKTPCTDSSYSNLSIVKRNTERLLTLVNQLLDFRKAEAAEMKLNFVSTDVCGVVMQVANRFKPSLQLKGISFEISSPQSLNAHIDIEAFTKVLSNLLWNALKHADLRISIEITECSGNIRITVSNDGELIPENKLNVIFEPFVKVDEHSEGSGIGLALVRKLVEAHDGKIIVDQQDGTVKFIITLPVIQKYAMDIKPKSVIIENTGIEEIPLPSCKSAPTVLIAEDNDDMLNLMARQLKESFNVITARSGEEAVSCMENNYIDMLVSDVMMPGMNGMELCRFAKGNIKYSHIPVLLLTANTDADRRIEGLEQGADEYLIKPYSIDYLKARILNLIENRRKLMNIYKSSPDIPIDTIAENEANSAFMSELMSHISDNLNNERLNVDFLADKMNISRATLYRKINGISNQSPNEFIRLVRLKKAAVLLREQNLRINEISDMCGFSSPSYFTKCFCKQFGKSPKEYQNAGASVLNS